MPASRPEPAPPERVLREAGAAFPPDRTRAPRVIAHRGASARRLENTLEAFAEAIRLGARALEMDVQRSRDGAFVVFHDRDLTATTDAGARFAHRRGRSGRLRVPDLDRGELQELRLHPRADRPRLPPAPLGIPTLEAVLSLAEESHAVSGQPLSLYLELKDPALHAGLGVPLEKPLLELLERRGWNVPDGRVALLSADPASLRTLRFGLGTALPLGRVVGAPGAGSPSPLEEHALEALRRYAELVVLEKGHLAGPAAAARVTRAKRLGLAVLPYTYRGDDAAPGYPALEDELRHALGTLEVDGVFTDDPDRALAVLRALPGSVPERPGAEAAGRVAPPGRPGPAGEPAPV